MRPDGSFPDFIVIGAMRAGTTTLYHHLANHPEIGMSRMKETDFFIPDLNNALGLTWYRGQFQPGFAVYGEVSPSYTMGHIWPGVPLRIKQVAPQVRLIFIVRDPVDRFVSQYLHTWHIGRTRVPPCDVLDSKVGQNMLETSRYAAQINLYLAQFPTDRVLILDFDELCTEPQRTMDRVTDVLGVDRAPVSDIGPQNDHASIARMPQSIQRAWRNRNVRRLDRLVSRGMRDRARRLLSIGPRRPDPEIGAELRAEVARRLAEDAAAFRRLSGQAFPGWQV